MTKIKFDLTLDSILLNCQQVSRLVGTQSAKFKCSDTNPREAGLHSVEIKLLHIAGQKSLDMYYKNRRQGFEADASMGIPQCDCRSDPTYNIMVLISQIIRFLVKLISLELTYYRTAGREHHFMPICK